MPHYQTLALPDPLHMLGTARQRGRLIILTAIIVVIVTPVVLVTAFFAVELMAGLRPLRLARTDGSVPRTAIVVPAHDEEGVIAETVRGLIEAASGALVLVVADNCTDGTAASAREEGAQVLVRDEPERRGKGFALAAAREWLRSDPPDVVLIIDADCWADRASIDALARSASASGRPCQAVYLLEPDLNVSPTLQISNFAFLIKNLVRQRGLQRLGGRAHLTGTGMAMPWPIFAASDLGGSNIVEDLALGLELASRNLPPMLREDAKVWSKAASDADTLTQRRRWEGGYLTTALHVAPRALSRSLRSGDFRGLWAALDLSVPPLALLVMLNALALLVSALAIALGANSWPLMVQVAVGLLALIVLAIAWAREGRDFVSAGSLARLPLYLLWKVPLYLGLARRGAPKDWVRTGR